MRISHRYLFGCVLLLGLSACAGMPVGSSRSVQQLMPLIRGQYNLAYQKLQAGEPVATQNLDQLRMLMEELKSSSSSLYTSDTLAWKKSCDYALAQIEMAREAWISGHLGEAKEALRHLGIIRDEAHQKFNPKHT